MVCSPMKVSVLPAASLVIVGVVHADLREEVRSSRSRRRTRRSTSRCTGRQRLHGGVVVDPHLPGRRVLVQPDRERRLVLGLDRHLLVVGDEVEVASGVHAQQVLHGDRGRRCCSSTAGCSPTPESVIFSLPWLLRDADEHARHRLRGGERLRAASPRSCPASSGRRRRRRCGSRPGTTTRRPRLLVEGGQLRASRPCDSRRGGGPGRSGEASRRLAGGRRGRVGGASRAARARCHQDRQRQVDQRWASPAAPDRRPARTGACSLFTSVPPVRRSAGPTGPGGVARWTVSAALADSIVGE